MERRNEPVRRTSRTIPEEIVDEILRVAQPFTPDGHFLYPADRDGSHTRGFFAFEPVARHPEFVDRIADDMAEWFRAQSIQADVLFAPGHRATRSLADTFAREVGVDTAYWEYLPSGRFGDRLVAGSVAPGSRALVFNSVSLQGRCVGLRLPEFVERLGGEVVGAAVFAKGTADLVRRAEALLGPRFYSTLQVEVPIYRPDACPLCGTSGQPVPWTRLVEAVAL